MSRPNIFSILTSKYGAETKHLFSETVKCETKLIATRSAITFLKRCKKNNVFPTHILNAFKTVTYTIGQVSGQRETRQKMWLEKSMRFVLNMELDQLFEKLKMLTGKLRQLENRFSRRVRDDAVFKTSYMFMKSLKNRLTSSTNKRLQRKFDALHQAQIPRKKDHAKKNWLKQN